MLLDMAQRPLPQQPLLQLPLHQVSLALLESMVEIIPVVTLQQLTMPMLVDITLQQLTMPMLVDMAIPAITLQQLTMPMLVDMAIPVIMLQQLTMPMGAGVCQVPSSDDWTCAGLSFLVRLCRWLMKWILVVYPPVVREKQTSLTIPHASKHLASMMFRTNAS
jgi:hypothetical protein